MPRYLAGTLQAPDHGGRLLYDDINEVFWERAATGVLQQARVTTELAETRYRSEKEKGKEATADNEKTAEQGTGPRLAVTRENLNLFFCHLLRGKKPQEGVKTFMERRTYVQVRDWQRLWLRIARDVQPTSIHI